MTERVTETPEDASIASGLRVSLVTRLCFSAERASSLRIGAARATVTFVEPSAPGFIFGILKEPD